RKGPAGGFVYKKRKNRKGVDVGGIVPHVSLKSIAQNEPPEETLLVDRAEEDEDVTRVSGVFTVEAVIPPSAQSVEGVTENAPSNILSATEHIDRIIGALARAGSLRLPGGGLVELRNVRRTARSVDIH